MIQWLKLRKYDLIQKGLIPIYTEKQRDKYYEKIVSFFKNSELFEGVVQIGSGTAGYTDIYSDIDLMAACSREEDLVNANGELMRFLYEIGASYLNQHKWSRFMLGINAFFENGLGIDCSIGPTQKHIICSSQWNIALDKTGALTAHIQEENKRFVQRSDSCSVDENILFKCLNGIRRCRIAQKREDYIYAANMLHEAREAAVEIAIVNEGKKLHQFKSFVSLSPSLQDAIKETYPTELTETGITAASHKLQAFLFLVAKNNPSLSPGSNLLSVLAE